MLREYDNMKEEVINLNTSTVPQRFQANYKPMLSYSLENRQNTESKIRNNVKTMQDKKIIKNK